MAADSLRDFTLGNLDPEQRAAVTAPAGPVCILAGAGTGKTRAITHRIAHRVVTGQVQPGHVLAVTFTARAAAQLRERLGGLAAHGVPARTFHAAALRQLRYFAPRLLRGREMPELVTSKARLVTLAATKAGFRTDRIVARDLAGEIEWAKSSLIEPDDYVVAVAKAERETPLDPASVVRVYSAYEQVKRASGVMDFEDLLRAMIWGIEEHPDVAEQVRDQYRHFVVDEYQDVNPLQQRLLEAWLGRRSDLTVVGDVAQTIYSFTGASASYLMDFARTYRNATVVRLVRDYRSTPEVVALANTVIAQARGAEARLRLDLIGQRPSGPKPDMRVFLDEPAEATAVARRCAELIATGTPASEIAVLFRANAQSEAYEEALSDTGVPYVVRGGERFFERAEVHQAMLALRSATKSTSELAMPDRVVEVLRGTGWEPDRPPAGGANRERWEAMAALYRLATELSQLTMLEFATELERRSAAQHIPTVDGVTLASLHSAKGLEWDAVFLVGLVEGTLPTAYAKTPQAVEEERRLLYVGITRARHWLWLSYGQSRSPGGRARKACRFLPGFGGGESPRIGLPREKKVVERRAVAAAVPCRICGATLLAGTDRKLGRCATCPSDIDETLMANLQEWRRQTAADQSVPAYVVFTDATLVAIAERKPERTEELVAIAGIGPRKLDLYGAEVLALVSGASPDDLAAKKKLATEP